MPETRPLPPIVILSGPISPPELSLYVGAWFDGMVKYVVDVRQGLLALGGEMHVDAETVLLEAGSAQDDLWGANYWPGRGPEDCIEYTSLINISPRRGNRALEIQDPEVRTRVAEITYAILGSGEPLP